MVVRAKSDFKGDQSPHQKNAALGPDKAPGDHCVSKLLGVAASDLREVSLERGLARRKGEINVVDRERIGELMTRSGLTNVLARSRESAKRDAWKEPKRAKPQRKHDRSWKLKKKSCLCLRQLAG